jgi:TonB family protein
MLAVLLIATADGAGAKSNTTAAKSHEPGKIEDTLLSLPRVDYPYAARRAQITGSGIIVLDIDLITGRAHHVLMGRSTGAPMLDNAAVTAFRQARFRPGTKGPVKIQITFTLGGPIVTGYQVKQKPMDDVLAHFLGRGTVRSGPMPDYPRFPDWNIKQGKGLYELHANRDGKVDQVRILKPSGDATFDRVTVKALRRWRLTRGPIIVVLPLKFHLTPTKYSVEIPKDM